MEDKNEPAENSKSFGDDGVILDRTRSIVDVHEISNGPSQATNPKLGMKIVNITPIGFQDVEAAVTPSGVKCPEGVRLTILTIALTLLVFVMSLDKSIIATAIPKISTEFQSIDDIGWYTSAYLLPLMALQPTFSKIYTYFDMKIVFLCALYGISVLALQWGGTNYPWSNSKVWALILSFGLLLTSFTILQLYLGDRATIPLRIFLNRSLTLSLLTSALLYLGTIVHTFYLPFYFQSAKGTSAAGSGLRMLPYTVTLSVSQLVVGSAVASIGLYLPFMWSGAAIFTIGAGLLTSFKLCATAVRASVRDKKDIPISSALTIFAPFFGSSLAATIAQNIFRVELIHSLQDSEVANDTNAIVAARAIDGVNLVPGTLRDVVREAYNVAASKTFMIALVSGGLAFFCTLGIEWKSIKKPAKVESPIRDEDEANNATEEREKHV
ncbi:hypothetical protein SBOR_8551 [Sclerotinia borealis F-4128]|uniref:Uncharacterized protein n=1 Tax=Sclerotinia borealis (strain F-4128) TaxID=1432307 RepID=W9C2P2_SCLBF|nr:hypothetical protein SBOR_8551 [Sclerotinia borealis F-4128]